MQNWNFEVNLEFESNGFDVLCNLSFEYVKGKEFSESVQVFDEVEKGSG